MPAQEEDPGRVRDTGNQIIGEDDASTPQHKPDEPDAVSHKAPMESFFHTLKVELPHQRRWPTRHVAIFRDQTLTHLGRCVGQAKRAFKPRPATAKQFNLLAA
jgi:hypothetical protein